MPSVTVVVDSIRRSERVCCALAQGFRTEGWTVSVVPVKSWQDNATHPDLVAFYGLRARLRDIYRQCQRVGTTTMFLDVGYMGRGKGDGRYGGFYRVSINDLHPTEHFQKHRHPSDRFRTFGLKAETLDWNPGGDILIAGMSAKAAWVYGLEPEEWEDNISIMCCEAADRLVDKGTLTSQVVYRPKPSWDGSGKISGTQLDRGQKPVQMALRRARLVISHHSNICVEAALLGVPVICAAGVGRALGCRWDNAGTLLEDLMAPHRPTLDERLQFLSDLAYTQWELAEIAQGKAARHFRTEGLIG